MKFHLDLLGETKWRICGFFYLVIIVEDSNGWWSLNKISIKVQILLKLNVYLKPKLKLFQNFLLPRWSKMKWIMRQLFDSIFVTWIHPAIKLLLIKCYRIFQIEKEFLENWILFGVKEEEEVEESIFFCFHLLLAFFTFPLNVPMIIFIMEVFAWQKRKYRDVRTTNLIVFHFALLFWRKLRQSDQFCSIKLIYQCIMSKERRRNPEILEELTQDLLEVIFLLDGAGK